MGAQLGAYLAGAVRELMANKVKFRDFIGNQIYTDLIYKIVEFNEGIDLRTTSCLDSLQIENCDINIILLDHISDYQRVLHCLLTLQLQYINQ
jgi:hypothetical protein